jgi:multidrug efflux system membrane fusion protein
MELEAARKLNAQGHRADTQLAQSQALYETARTAVMRTELDIERTTIRAPFAGVVETRAVEVGDFLKIGELIATVVDLDPALVVGHISEHDIGKLAVGGTGRARLIGGHEVEGRIRFISTVADEKTRTFRVELEVPNAEGKVVDGMTAEIYLAGEKTMAHRISPALLTLSDQGAVGVKILDADDRVVFVPVQMVDASAEAIWLTGLPESIRVITVGQEFVRHGELVAADETGAAEASR